MLRLLPLALLVAVAGCSGSRPDAPAAPALGADGTPVVASWTADTLTLAGFEAEFAAADGALADTVQTPRERRLDFLDRYVDFRLKVLAARQAGYDQDSSYLAEVADYRDQLAGPYFTDRQVLDGIVRDIYDKQAEEVETSHILLLLSPAERDTAAVYARLVGLRDSIEAGQISFADAARRYSEDPSAQRPEGQPGAGGELGYLTGGRTVLPFEDAAYDTPVGEIAGPVRTQFGVHLLQVTDRRAVRPEIGARHILIRTDSTTTPDQARAVIEGLRARVLAGESFQDLAREYSQDPGSGARGGDLGTFGRGRMVPPFEAAAFALENVGDVSEPVESRFGVHLIQLTSLGERPSFEQAFPALRQQALRLPRTALRRQAIGREAIEQAGGTYDEALVREAVMQYGDDGAAQLMSLGFGDYSDRAFATVGDSTYTLSDLVPVFRQLRQGLPHPEGQMIEAARAFVDEQGAELALARLETRDPEFARVFKSYADGVLLFRIAEDSVWTPAKEDVAGLRRVYDANPGAYRWPERRRVLAFRAASDSLLLTLADRIDRGSTAAQAYEMVADDVRRDTLFVSDSTGTGLDQVLSLFPGQKTGVVMERGRRTLYYLDGIEPPRTKTFQEARAELITALPRPGRGRLGSPLARALRRHDLPRPHPGLADGARQRAGRDRQRMTAPKSLWLVALLAAAACGSEPSPVASGEVVARLGDAPPDRRRPGGGAGGRPGRARQRDRARAGRGAVAPARAAGPRSPQAGAR